MAFIPIFGTALERFATSIDMHWIGLIVSICESQAFTSALSSIRELRCPCLPHSASTATVLHFTARLDTQRRTNEPHISEQRGARFIPRSVSLSSFLSSPPSTHIAPSHCRLSRDPSPRSRLRTLHPSSRPLLLPYSFTHSLPLCPDRSQKEVRRETIENVEE